MRWIAATWIVMVVGTASAQPLTGSPGPLASSHAALDDPARCDACHVNGTAAVSNTRCLACHGALAARGLHATSLVRGRRCEICHGEHRGRGFALQGWRALPGGIQAFDHGALAGWRLVGKHATAACTQCHTTTTAGGHTRFTGLSMTCGASGCHLATQPHGLVRPELLRCDRCHGELGWKPVKRVMEFDHDDLADAAMPLVGAHARTPCIQCHVGGRFDLASPTPAACEGCHPVVPHTSRLFEQRPCAWCHAPTARTFKAYAFDHGERTSFPTEGGHRIACSKCHTTARGSVKPPPRCEDCHAQLATHGRRFDAVRGGCASCHVGQRWKTMRFDHARQTTFGLRGKHGMIACRACHRGTGPADFERFTLPRCTGCHEHATVHADAAHPKGRFTDAQCIDCHGPAWNHPDPPRTSAAAIVHGFRSPFPLVGGHKVVPCLDCHPTRDARGQTRWSGESMECGARCHVDVHAGRLGAQCTACHAAGRWEAVNFDHDRDPFPDGSRGYALEGDHARLPCEACHQSRQFRGTPRRCADAACHAADDSHGGQLGTTCDRCHLANGDNRFNHAIMSRFPLDGKHTRVACEDCHPGGALKPRPRTCYGCHPEPRAHCRAYGTYCERCHTTAAWR